MLGHTYMEGKICMEHYFKLQTHPPCISACYSGCKITLALKVTVAEVHIRMYTHTQLETHTNTYPSIDKNWVRRTYIYVHVHLIV